MKIFVTAKPNSKQEKVEQIDQNHFNVWTKELPIENKASIDIATQIAKHFNVAKSQVTLLSGSKSKKKIYEIDI